MDGREGCAGVHSTQVEGARQHANTSAANFPIRTISAAPHAAWNKLRSFACVVETNTIAAWRSVCFACALSHQNYLTNAAPTNAVAAVAWRVVFFACTLPHRRYLTNAAPANAVAIVAWRVVCFACALSRRRYVAKAALANTVAAVAWRVVRLVCTLSRRRYVANAALASAVAAVARCAIFLS